MGEQELGWISAIASAAKLLCNHNYISGIFLITWRWQVGKHMCDFPAMPRHGTEIETDSRQVSAVDFPAVSLLVQVHR